MQDLASEFSKIFRGDTLGPPPAPNTHPGLWPGAGRPTPAFGRARALTPRCWYPNLGLPELFSRGCAPDYYYFYALGSIGPGS